MPILKFPDLNLRNRATPVAENDNSLNQLITNLADTLLAGVGIGLSANQIGDDRAVFVLDLFERKQRPVVYVNPRVISKSRMALIQESCLSVPETVGYVFRHTRVHISAFDENGQAFEQHLEDMHAVAFLHEMDHLHGKLFIDRLWWLPRLRFHARNWRRAVPAA